MVPEIWSATGRIFCHSGTFFALLPLYGPRKSKFWKKKKIPEDIILQMCTINDSHTTHGCWDMECNGQNFLSFWTILCPFTPLATTKIKILKQLKKAWGYYHFTHVYHKWQSYDVWFLRYWAWWTEFFVILDHFLPFSSANNPKNQNFEKWKNHTHVKKVGHTPEFLFGIYWWTWKTTFY